MPIPYILLTGFYCFLIFQNSAVSDPFPMDVDLPFNDKFAHAVVFGGLCGLVSLGMSRATKTPAFAVLILVPVLFTTAYGLTDEIHQRNVPFRTFDLFDLLADFVGATIMQSILVLHWSWTRRRARLDGRHSQDSATSNAV